MPIETEVPRRGDLPIKAPRGTAICCKSWQQEAALRMLMNTVEVVAAQKLAIHGGTGRDARSWADYDAVVQSLKSLGNDETLLVQSGKLVDIFRTHEYAPRVLIASNERDRHSWSYIGSQGTIQATFETFAAVADKHFGGELAGKLIVSGGMGEMGGAQPLAATMAGACFLGVEVDAERIKRQLRSGYLDFMVNSLDEALRILKNAIRKKENISVGLIGNCAEVIPELADRGVLPDILTDQTSAHDTLNGYVPNGMALAAALELRQRDPKAYEERSLAAIARHVEGMLRLQKMGAVTFDYGNNICTFAQQGVRNANDIPGFVSTYLWPLCRQGRGPLRWIALSGDASDIAAIDDLVLQLFPQDRVLKRWIDVARTRIRFQGLPARSCWLGRGERAQLGLAINELVKQGKVKAPIVIAGDHLDCGSAVSACGETEGMKDSDDAAANWPMLNALLNTASGASWVSLHHGGGPGIGSFQHAGWVTVADGTDEMARRIERVLTNAAGDAARDSARQAGTKIPMDKMSGS